MQCVAVGPEEMKWHNIDSRVSHGLKAQVDFQSGVLERDLLTVGELQCDNQAMEIGLRNKLMGNNALDAEARDGSGLTPFEFIIDNH